MNRWKTNNKPINKRISKIVLTLSADNFNYFLQVCEEEKEEETEASEARIQETHQEGLGVPWGVPRLLHPWWRVSVPFPNICMTLF